MKDRPLEWVRPLIRRVYEVEREIQALEGRGREGPGV